MYGHTQNYWVLDKFTHYIQKKYVSVLHPTILATKYLLNSTWFSDQPTCMYFKALNVCEDCSCSCAVNTSIIKTKTKIFSNQHKTSHFEIIIQV